MRRLLSLAVMVLAGAFPASAQQVVLTEAGAGPTGLPGTVANLSQPGTLHRSASGDLLILTNGRLIELDASGVVRVLAGDGVNCGPLPYGDGGPARNSCLSIASGLTRETPKGVIRDAAGNIYIADTGHHAIRRIDAVTGIITRWAGLYAGSYNGDGIQASDAGLYRPHQIVFDAGGNMYIADRGNHRIRRVSASTGIITTVAGNGVRTDSIDGPYGSPADNLGDGLPATEATLNLPYGLAVDSAGNIYIGDSGNYRIRKVSAATGTIATIAGNGTPGYGGEDVPGTDATLAGPAGLFLEAGGSLLIADAQWDLRNVFPIEEDLLNHHVRRLNLATGIISTVAGGEGFAPEGDVGDGGPGLGAPLYQPSHAVSDSAGNLYIADQYHHRVRKVTASTGIIDTIAGNGTHSYAGDGYPSRRSRLYQPGSIEIDPSGNLYIADHHNHRVRRLDAATGVIGTVAGNGDYNTSGDGGPATAASLQIPEGMAFDGAGNLYIADVSGNVVRKVTMATGIITTVAGNGLYGYAGDGGQAKQARLASPMSVAVNAAGDLFIADTDNSRVRRVSAATGIITTAAGTGWALHELDGPGGDPGDEINDGGPATSASVTYPLDVLVDQAGNLLIADFSSRLRKVDISGVITTIAGNGVPGATGDGGPATSAAVTPERLAFDAAGHVFLTDARRVRRIDAATGIITTLVGNSSSQFVPDGTAAAAASFASLAGLAVDAAGRIHLSEQGSYQVRLVGPSPGASAVPDGAAGDKPLTVTRAANGDLTLSWGFPCLGSDFDFEIYEGTIGVFTGHAPRFCSTGGAMGATFTPAAGNTFYLVVPRNGMEEGSYGLRSDGSQRPAPAGACLPQRIAGSCQ